MNLNKEFLPISKEDMAKRGIKQLDFIIITGDAYVDHPSFGTAIIGRLLEKEGFSVGIIAQPDWHSVDDFKRLGKPKHAFLINSGNIDSMVNHYTSAKKRRHDDLYSPGGKSGYRPDRAVIVYSNRAKEAYKDVPIILGGIEASLRRFAHYDYWSDKIRRSILLDSKADLLIYGMGEKPIKEIANLVHYGMDVKEIKSIRGTVYLESSLNKLDNYIEVPSFEEVIESKEAYGESFKIQAEEQDAVRGKIIVQKHGNSYIIQNPPSYPLTVEEMDESYDLPYVRTYHPIYEKDGGIPAIREVSFSITSHRGCFGSCSFCALTFHQGRVIQKRSEHSIIEEAKLLTHMPDFKGYIHDIGGPTANFRNKACKVQGKVGVCKHRQCLFPSPCKNLIIDHSEYLNLLRKVRKLPNIKKVFIRSGIRYDYLTYDKNPKFLEELCKYHVSGQLKVAPEHVSDQVLNQMGKPTRKIYDEFCKKYSNMNKRLGLKQYLVPYLMSSHPGSTLKEAIKLSLYIKNMGYNPEQVQDFYPTPGSLSTTIYYTGFNPFTKEKVYVPKKQEEKSMQRALLQFRDPKNYDLVKKALILAHREDLIGTARECLIPETKPKSSKHMNGSSHHKKSNNKRTTTKNKSDENHNVHFKNNNSKEILHNQKNRKKASRKSIKRK